MAPPIKATGLSGEGCRMAILTRFEVVTCFMPQRAPSSQLACLLNMSFFPHFCTRLTASLAVGRVESFRRRKPCGSLQRSGFEARVRINTQLGHLLVFAWVADGECVLYLFGKELPISPGSHGQLSVKSSCSAFTSPLLRRTFRDVTIPYIPPTSNNKTTEKCRGTACCNFWPHIGGAYRCPRQCCPQTAAPPSHAPKPDLQR